MEGDRPFSTAKAKGTEIAMHCKLTLKLMYFLVVVENKIQRPEILDPKRFKSASMVEVAK